MELGPVSSAHLGKARGAHQSAGDFYKEALKYEQQGELNKAQACYQQALSATENLNSTEFKVSQTLARIYLDYAGLLEKQRDVTEAGNAYQHAQRYGLDAYRLEPDQTEVQSLLRNIGLCRSQYLLAQGLSIQSDQVLQETIQSVKENTADEAHSDGFLPPTNDSVSAAHQSNLLPASLLSSIQAANPEGKIVVQICHGKMTAAVNGNNNKVKFYSPENPELLPQIKEIHTSVGELKAAYLDRVKGQQALELRSKKEPLAILGQNIEAEYFTAWEEPGEIQDGLAMYVAPQATTITDKKTFFDLDETVTTFLTQTRDSGQKTQVLLLRGEAGSGKSTFNRHLARRLWRDYSAASGEEPIPLYISLPTIDRPNKNLISQYLSDKCGFSSEQIDALRANQRFIFILDGYDEIPAEQRNLYADEKLDQWQAKILLSCRPEYLTEGYKNHLQPRGRSRVLLEYQLAPFSEHSIETYIHQYVEYTQAEWSTEDYQARLAQIPNVKELLGTPFLLKMALSVLPKLDETRPGQIALTRIKLYEQFVHTWFERSLARLNAIQSKLTETQKSAFYGLKEDGFIEHSQTFNTDFAFAMSKAQTTVAAYSPFARHGILQDKRYEAFLSNQDEGKKLLRFSALLTRQQQQYRFIHKSIQDYLVARAVWEELENFTELGSSNHSMQLNLVEKVRVLWEALSPSVQMDTAALLNTFNVVEDLAIQRFLVERVQQNGALLKPLLAWIKASKRQNNVSMAAANAITILIKAGMQFHEADLIGIQIPGADLSFGVFDSAQLQGADLSKVNLRDSWLRHANLSAAKMSGVRFGERAYLHEKSKVYSCAYSPDGENCALGLVNGTISVYTTSNWEKTYSLEGHTGSVSSVAYSPSGSQIASGSSDTTVRLWDAHSGAAGRILEGHTDNVRSVVYSPSGLQIASGSSDTTVRLWDAHSGAAMHILEGHADSVSSVAYSPSGSQIASGSRDNTVRLWDAHSGAAVHTLEGHTDSVSSVVYSPSGSQLASGGLDKTVRLWDAESGASVHTLEGHTSNVTSVAYSPSGLQIASGSNDNTVRLWDAHSGAAGHTLEGHKDWVNSVVYSPSGSQIASGSDDTTLRLWDAHSGAAGHTLKGHTSKVTSVAYSLSGSQIASGSYDKTVRLWGAHSGAAGHTLEGHTNWVNSVVYSPSGSQIASGSDDKTVRLWDAHSGAAGHALEGHTASVYSVAYSPSGTQIASGSKDNTVRLWDAHSGAVVHTLGHTRAVTSVAYSPSGTQLASGSYDKTVRLWDAHSGAAGHTLEGHTHWVNSVAYSPSGTQIASGSEDKTVRLWDAESGAAGHTLKGHTSWVTSVVYSPSGLQLASGSHDKTVRLWEVASGACLRVIQGFTGTVNSVAWKAMLEGSYLLTGSDNNLVRQWAIGEGDEERVRLIWMSPHSGLAVEGMLIEGVEDLSEVNRALLKQRGCQISVKKDELKAGWWQDVAKNVHRFFATKESPDLT
ncbi:MAG: WD40 repeat [Glomeribacter sp. 1016415]|nr:WD40 repeat [Glomeribacter sp. 1016415]